MTPLTGQKIYQDSCKISPLGAVLMLTCISMWHVRVVIFGNSCVDDNRGREKREYTSLSMSG